MKQPNEEINDFRQLLEQDELTVCHRTSCYAVKTSGRGKVLGRIVGEVKPGQPFSVRRLMTVRFNGRRIVIAELSIGTSTAGGDFAKIMAIYIKNPNPVY